VLKSVLPLSFTLSCHLAEQNNFANIAETHPIKCNKIRYYYYYYYYYYCNYNVAVSESETRIPVPNHSKLPRTKPGNHGVCIQHGLNFSTQLYRLYNMWLPGINCYKVCFSFTDWKKNTALTQTLLACNCFVAHCCSKFKPLLQINKLKKTYLPSPSYKR